MQPKDRQLVFDKGSSDMRSTTTTSQDGSAITISMPDEQQLHSCDQNKSKQSKSLKGVI